MTVGVHDPLSEGREALSRHDWRAAYEQLSAADRAGLADADALHDLMFAAWWTGESDAVIEIGARAFSAFLTAGRKADAAKVADFIAHTHGNRGEGSAANGWIAKAARVLEGEPEGAGHVALEMSRAVFAQYGGRPQESVRHAEEALRIAEALGDQTMLALALNRLGSILVYVGRVQEGQAYLDESMVAAVSGDLDPFWTGVIYCTMISSCQEVADYRRAGEWTEAARRWCERQSISGFPGICRVHRADVMRLRGRWADAEVEARQAQAELTAHGLPAVAAAGAYEVGEIRLRMGDFAGAETAFEQAHALGHDPQPGLAVLRMLQGRLDQAAAALAAALRSVPEDRLQRSRILPAQVEVAVRTGDLETARAAVAELDAIAETYGSSALMAGAASCRAIVRMAEGDNEGALMDARRAWKLWRDLEAPYEEARVRSLLAEIHARSANPEAALLELRSARQAFEELGAVPDARGAAATMEALEQGDASRPRGVREVRTFMFTDIESSTNLLEVMGDEAWGNVLAWHDATLRTLFVEHRGEEITSTGDGFFVAFPDARDALRCAVAIQRALSHHRREHGFAPQVRIGVHAAEATRQDSNYQGRGVHAAARIGALGRGGEIVASRATADQSGGVAVVSEPRTVELKGISEPIEVVSVDWRSAPAG